MPAQRAETIWQERAKSRARASLCLSFLRLFILLGWSGLMLFSGLSAHYRSFLEKKLSTSIFVSAPVYLAVLLCSYIAVCLPVDWLEWRVEKRYGLSRESPAAWLRHLVVESAVGLVFGVGFFYVVYASFFGAGRWWWLAAGLISLGADLFLCRFLLQRLISLRHPLAPVANPSLTEKLRTLARNAGSQIQNFLQMKVSRETPAANAMVGGLGRERAIFFTDTLLDAFSEGEVETIAAHELGHDRHSHPLLASFLNFVTIASALLIAHFGLILLSPFFPRLSIREPADLAAFPILMFLLVLFAVVASPILAAISRRMERGADLFALKLSSTPQAFATALEKLAEINLIDPDPPRIVRFISRSPALRERIEIAKAFGEKKEPT